MVFNQILKSADHDQARIKKSDKDFQRDPISGT